jgi:hypothetical protein
MDDHKLSHDELAWLAFRYIAGELHGPELTQFELLLAEDQTAREAVASAVEISQATALAFAEQPTVAHGRIENPSYGVVRWAIWAAGVAACVLVAVGIVQWSVQWPQVSSPTASGKADALAARWSEVRAEQQADYPWQDDADEPGEVASDWALSVDELEARDAEELFTPEWMLAAVRQQREAEDLLGDMPGDIERGGDESQEQ